MKILVACEYSGIVRDEFLKAKANITQKKRDIIRAILWIFLMMVGI